jgi:hypothetical protein
LFDKGAEVKKIVLIISLLGLIGCAGDGRKKNVKSADAILVCLDLNKQSKKESFPTGYVCKEKADKNKRYYQIKNKRNKDLN